MKQSDIENLVPGSYELYDMKRWLLVGVCVPSTRKCGICGGEHPITGKRVMMTDRDDGRVRGIMGITVCPVVIEKATKSDENQ
jgi:hypothetical protein